MRPPGAYIYDGTGYAKGGVGVFAVYITSRMLSAVPALWFAGWLMKHRLRVPGRLIPYALAVLGVVLGLMLDGPSANSAAEGLVASALAVAGHQALRQAARIITGEGER